MKKNLNLIGIFAAVLMFIFLCVPITSQATTIEFIDRDVDLTEVRDGAYAGMYNAILGDDPIHVMCDDRQTTIYPNQSWFVDVLYYDDILAGKGKYGTDRSYQNGVTNYNRVGYLFSLTLGTEDKEKLADINSAIWEIMTPDLNTYAYNGAVDYYTKVTSVNTYDNFDWSNVMKVLTPDPYGSGQEFLTRVPEPGTMLLLGAGLIGLTAISRKRFIK